MLIIISISETNAQLSSDFNTDMCGIEMSSESYLNDPFFGNNQALVDLLIENGVNIPENYLNTLDERSFHNERDTERFSSESTVYSIPVKAWVYRNDNGTGLPMVQVTANAHPSNISELYVSVYNCNTPFWGNKIIPHVYSGVECNFHSPLPNEQIVAVDEDLNFVLYPNPAKEKVTIMSNSVEVFTLEIADKNRTIIYKNNKANKYEATVNNDSFQTGIYFVIIKYGIKQQIKRLIIKK
tara:strand:+ start:34626 stop:35345 length:720 start_codon:yes stop_codon:yes gene_type:complete